MFLISVANDNDGLVWNEFVSSVADSDVELCSHWALWQWRSVISNAFKHKPYYLIARTDKAKDSGNNIVGVMPIFYVKSFLFGSALISVPYLNGGGAIAKNPQVLLELIDYVKKLGKELNTNYVELRFRKSLSECLQSDELLSESLLVERSHKVAMMLKLPSNPQELFDSFPAKLRSQIRRPTKSGVFTEISSGYSSKEVNSFYEVFAHNMRDLGTPVYPKKLFIETTKQFGSNCKIIISRINTKPIACGITIGSGCHTEIIWASTLRSHNNLSPNMVMYWEALKDACENNYQFFDFGRSSPDSGTFKFKKQWGAVPVPLYWYYDINKGEMPDVNPKSSKYAFMVNAWRKLPLPFTKLLGTWITRSLP